MGPTCLHWANSKKETDFFCHFFVRNFGFFRKFRLFRKFRKNPKISSGRKISDFPKVRKYAELECRALYMHFSKNGQNGCPVKISQKYSSRAAGEIFLKIRRILEKHISDIF